MDLDLHIERSHSLKWAIEPPAVVFVALAVAVVLYWRTSASLLGLWNAFGSRYYTHGDLILLLAVLSLMRRRDDLRLSKVSPNRTAFAILFPLTVLWLVAYLSNVQLFHEILLPALLWFFLAAVFGFSIANLCRFPLLYLYFAIPIWDPLAVALQRITVLAAHPLLTLAGIPFTIRGNLIYVPAGTFEVHDSCAGLSYFIVGLAVASYYCDLNHLKMRGRVAVIALAGALALIGNWLRVVSIVVIGQLTHMQHYFVRVSHDGFGWTVFATVMVVFLILAPCMHELNEPAAYRQDGVRGDRSRLNLFAACMSLCVLAFGPAWAAVVAGHNYAKISDLPMKSESGWNGPAKANGEWHPMFAGADIEELGVYSREASELQVYVAAYASQTPTAKLHYVGNTVIGKGSYREVRQRRITVGQRSMQEIELLDREGHRWGIWLTYETGAFTSPSIVATQLAYGVQSLFSAPQSRVVAVRARCMQDCASVHEMVGKFLDNGPWLFDKS